MKLVKGVGRGSQLAPNHWRHLCTTNSVNSPFAALQLRTDAARRPKRVDNGTAVIWKLLLIAEPRLRRRNAPELLKEVCLGVQFVDGVAVNHQSQEAAA